MLFMQLRGLQLTPNCSINIDIMIKIDLLIVFIFTGTYYAPDRGGDLK